MCGPRELFAMRQAKCGKLKKGGALPSVLTAYTEAMGISGQLSSISSDLAGNTLGTVTSLRRKGTRRLVLTAPGNELTTIKKQQ
jgi:hypothetical protein